MWNIRLSRSKFLDTYSHKAQPLDPLVSGLLGESVHNAGQGNYSELDRFMRAFTRTAGNNSSSGVYCGLTPKIGTPSSLKKGHLVHSYRYSKRDDAAWIALDLRYLEMLAGVVDADLLFPRTLAAASGKDEVIAQNLLDNVRSSMFKHVGTDYPGDHHDYDDGGQLFALSRGEIEWKPIAHSAIFFVMAHELDHLLRDGNKRRNEQEISARIEKAKRNIKPLWPMPSERGHIDELLADDAAVEIVGEAAVRAGLSLVAVMKGSLLAMATVAFDGWFMNKSAVAESHPSAFARVYGLLGAWLGFLSSHNDVAWSQIAQPTSSQLWEVAHSFVFVEWVAGLYRKPREGFSSVVPDLRKYHDLLCSAAGLPQPVRIFG